MPGRAVTAQRDRRLRNRLISRIKTPCRLKRATEEGAWTATIQNISAEGIGLLSNRPFKPGSYLTLRMPTGTNQLGEAKMMRILHVKSQPGTKWWYLGGSFTQKLTNEELGAVRARSPSIVPRSERRTTIRHTTRMKEPCQLLRTSEPGPWLARIRNVSAEGISLIANRPFRAGLMLTVELPVKCGRHGKARLLRVTHVRQQVGSPWWVLGGQFLTPLVGDELAALV